MEPLFDLNVLDEFLSSDASPNGCMRLSTLDGFLTGIASLPTPIPSSKWLPVIWGGSSPEFSDADQEATILRTIMDRYIEIGRCNPKGFEPIFWMGSQGKAVADDWTHGLLAAMQFRADVWQSRLKDPEWHRLLITILALSKIPEPDNADQPVDVAIKKAIDTVPATVTGIREYWQARSDGPKQPVDRQPATRGRRTGRR
jgi:uncharacterized protein